MMRGKLTGCSSKHNFDCILFDIVSHPEYLKCASKACVYQKIDRLKDLFTKLC